MLAHISKVFALWRHIWYKTSNTSFQAQPFWSWIQRDLDKNNFQRLDTVLFFIKLSIIYISRIDWLHDNLWTAIKIRIFPSSSNADYGPQDSIHIGLILADFCTVATWPIPSIAKVDFPVSVTLCFIVLVVPW